MSDRSAVTRERLTGIEPFVFRKSPADFTVQSFWQWMGSSLLDNTMCGLLAEYLVARALGVAGGARAGWDEGDVVTASVQSWNQEKPSAIKFGIAPTQGWDRETGKYSSAQQRQADVYVFCLLAKSDQATVDPLDLDQWEFIVLGSHKLDEGVGAQKPISLNSLRTLGPREVDYEPLANAVGAEAAGRNQ